MGIFQRVSNVLKAKTNKALDKVEDPIELLDLQITESKEALMNAKKESASLIGSIPNIDRNIADLEKKSVEYKKAAKGAKNRMESATSEEEKAKHKEAALKFLKKDEEVTREIESKKLLKSKNETQIKRVKDQINRLDDKIKEMVIKKDELKSRMNTANASAKVNELISGINDKSFKSVDEIERQIEEKENYAQGLDDMTDKTDEELNDYLSEESNLEDKFNNL